jgi:hypothetical protein
MSGLIYQNCKQLNVITDLLCFYQAHVSWNERGKMDTPQQITDLYMDYTGAQEIFLGDPYPLIARRPNCLDNGKDVNSQIPNTLPKVSGDSILANIISTPANYDAWLQAQIDNLPFLKVIGIRRIIFRCFSYPMKAEMK